MFRLASKFKILIFYGQFYDFFRWKKAAKKETKLDDFDLGLCNKLF